MNRKSIITALLTLVVAVGYAQQVMLADSISKNPVGYATIYDADGTVVGRSDMGGYVRLKKGLEIVFADSIAIGRCEVFADKDEMLFSIDALWPRDALVTNLFGYTQVLSKHNRTELYRYDDSDAPSVFNLKSSNSYRHLTLTHKKENIVRDIDVEDMFYVVEFEYTDAKESSSSASLREDYEKYAGLFPVVERIREQLVREE